LSAPAPQSGCAEGWYRLKRKSVSGNSISPCLLCFPFKRSLESRPAHRTAWLGRLSGSRTDWASAHRHLL